MSRMGTKILVLGLLATAGLTIPAAANATASATEATGSTAGSAACEVWHHFYTKAGYYHVELKNECTTTRTVCIGANGGFIAGPYKLTGLAYRDTAYGVVNGGIQGDRVYYC